MTDQPTPDEQRLMPLITVDVLRSRALHRGQTILARPFPDCHKCGASVTAARKETGFPHGHRTITLTPCGHTAELDDATAHKLRTLAEQAADQIEQQHSVAGPDWLRGGLCCGCQGAGGPVVYRNHRDQPFCEHCAECDCRTIPCCRPAPATAGDLRDRLAAALEAADYRPDMRRGDLADAILPVIQGELEQLREQLGAVRTELAIEKAISADLRVESRARGEKLDRVRQLAERWENALTPDLAYARSLRAALNPQEQP